MKGFNRRNKSSGLGDSESKPAFDQQQQHVNEQHNTAIINPGRSAKVLAVLLLFAAALGSFGYFVTTEFDRSQRNGESTTKSTIKSLDEIRAKNEGVIEAFAQCERTLAAGQYLYSRELAACRDAVITKVKGLQHLRDREASSMAQASLALVDTAIAEESQDLLEISQVAFLEETLESSVVRSFWQYVCLKKGSNGNNAFVEALKNDTDRSFRELPGQMNSQNRLYFVIRDFIVPRLNHLQKMLEGNARQIGGLDDGNVFRNSKQAYESSLQAQGDFKERPESFPFNASNTRRMESRDFVSTYDDASKLLHQSMEDNRFENTKQQITLKALRGRPEQVKELVDCKIFKPEAAKEFEKF